MSSKRSSYDAEFLQSTVQMVRESGKPIAHVARDLGNLLGLFQPCSVPPMIARSVCADAPGTHSRGRPMACSNPWSTLPDSHPPYPPACDPDPTAPASPDCSGNFLISTSGVRSPFHRGDSC